MTNSRRPLLPVFALAALLPASALAEGAMLKTVQTLDNETRGFCLDLPGRVPNIRMGDPLQVHTCKYGEDTRDQDFQWRDSGQIASGEFDVCAAAERLAAGSALYARACADTPEQTWIFGRGGELRPASRPDLCVTLASGYRLAGTPAWITPVYRARQMSLESCAAAAQARQQFRWGAHDEHPPSFADTLGRQMPPDLAAAIREIVSRGAGAQETSSLYANQPRVYEPGEIDVAANLAYGPHERHRLDVHTDTLRRDEGPMPVVMYFHGGGFVRGNRDGSRNVSDYFASLGLVGVNATYRLAPEAQWPAGSRDVARAVAWVRQNIGEYGGDPNRIYVIGKSAGAFHVAEFALRPSITGDAGPAVAGVVLVSGTYGADADDPSDNRVAYFGDDLSRWPGISVLGNIERSEIPLLATVSEFDGAGTKNSFAELIRELTVDYGRMPRALQLIGHDHYSPNPSVGTVDTQLSAEILHLIRATAGDRQRMSSN